MPEPGWGDDGVGEDESGDDGAEEPEGAPANGSEASGVLLPLLDEPLPLSLEATWFPEVVTAAEATRLEPTSAPLGT